ncbi:Cloroperoxidase [Lentinus tigrinus ALCF2SS1-7]|uniref:Cloroperoxidase n=1 Tax=Lentinus tigrinus ALCF2SS1-6 TaxID=1328759 RepID=A0A5C2SEZ2_9APHY|nr:Cloroperoxidase [Lentinus tigrinus ALCF2SS1-6]RPD76041.1 Cloroperoxidase [Lentinus tigrinus ALCF2SS1-7]
MGSLYLFIALRRLFVIVWSSLSSGVVTLGLYLWDIVLVLLNLITPDYKAGQVIPEGNPGHGGLWPKYSPPAEGDSRSPCPGLNAMANHGILPRNGKNIKFADLHTAIKNTYNISAPFSHFLPRGAAQLLDRDLAHDSFDLSDVSVHNMIEHDASFCRDEIYRDVTQANIASSVLEGMLSSATGAGGRLTASDMSRFLGKRRVQCRNDNPQFSLSLGQKFIGSTNAAFILKVFGGIVEDLRAFLLEERLPEGWEPRVRHRAGLTMTEINLTIGQVEFGVEEEVDGSMTAPRASAVGSAEKK